MQNTQPLRKTLGLTQEQLAGLLGIKRAELAMAERGIRLLPLKASNRLSLLEYSIAQPVETAISVNKPMMELQLEQCRRKLKQNILLLQKMQKQEAQNFKCMQALHLLAVQQPNDASKIKVNLWIASIQTLVQEELKHCGKTIQQIIECEILALQTMEQKILQQINSLL